jgi:hypothetical protein
VAPPEPADPRAARGVPIDGVARCCCCNRFPLVGEQVTRRRRRKGSGWVCERCEASGRGKRVGAALERDRIRSFGGAMNVRRPQPTLPPQR